jgi:hypothetical protein
MPKDNQQNLKQIEQTAEQWVNICLAYLKQKQKNKKKVKKGGERHD